MIDSGPVTLTTNPFSLIAWEARAVSSVKARLKTSRAAQRRSASIALLVIPLLLTLAGCGSEHARDAGPLSHFSSSPAFDQIKATHAEAATDKDQRALFTTWFVNGDPNVAEFCSVLPDGHVTTYRYVYNSAWHGGNKVDLTREQLSDLKQILETLPPSRSSNLRNLLIVSFRDYASGEWVTRTYDRTHRPGPVSGLFSTTGAPIEPPDEGTIDAR
jgi:hypothetical protein